MWGCGQVRGIVETDFLIEDSVSLKGGDYARGIVIGIQINPNGQLYRVFWPGDRTEDWYYACQLEMSHAV
jgi:hypothetical protein